MTNALEACARVGLKRVILISSCSGYPPSSSPLVEAEFYRGDPPSQWFGLGSMYRYLENQLAWHVHVLGSIGSAIVLRPALVYGPYDDFDPETAHFVPAFARRIVERQRPFRLLGDGSQRRSLLHARDLATAVWTTLRKGEAPWQVYNVAASGEVTVLTVLRELLDIDGFTDAEIVFEGSATESNALRIDASRIMSDIGWRPMIELRDGLQSVLSWYRELQEA